MGGHRAVASVVSGGGVSCLGYSVHADSFKLADGDSQPIGPHAAHEREKGEGGAAADATGFHEPCFPVPRTQPNTGD